MTTLEILTEYPLIYSSSMAVLGLCIGSFINVVVYRLPIMMEADWRQQCHDYLSLQDEKSDTVHSIDLIYPGSHCPHCKHIIPFWRNLPLISYALQRGRCAYCHEKISGRYPLVELLTAVLTVMVAYKYGVSWQALAGYVLTWALITLSFIDYDTQLLPDSVTLPLLWIGLLISIPAVFVDSSVSIIGAAAGYLMLWVVYYAFKLFTGKEGMGFGDFKLLAMLGAWLGWKMLPLIILMSSFAGAVIGIMLVLFKGRSKEKPIPFGPYLAIAGWCALMFGENILDKYLSFTVHG